MAAMRPFLVRTTIWVITLLLVQSAASPKVAWADGGAPATLDAPTAEQAFKEAVKAFNAADFTRAAQGFERAFELGPHESPLWNAARSWDKAGEPARAANAYARFLRIAPTSATDRGTARARLAELTSRLGRFDLHPPDVDARVDGERVHVHPVYVNPGTHLIVATVGGGSIRRSERVDAGAVVSVSFEPAAEEPSPTVPSAKSESTPRRRGLPPAVVVAGAAVTAIAVGLTVASGLDTLNLRDAFLASPSRDLLDDGRAAQTRTNVLVGTSILLGAVTGLLALVFVDFRGGPVSTLARTTAIGARNF